MDNQLQHQLNQYLLGELTPEETATFEAELSRNSDLATALEHAQGTLEAIRTYQKDQVRQELHAHRAKKKGRTQAIRWGAGIAATILVLISGFWLRDYFQQRTESPAEISTTFEPAELLLIACQEIQSIQRPVPKGAAPKDSQSNLPEVQALQSTCGYQLPAPTDSIRSWIADLETQIAVHPNSSYQGETYYLLGLLYWELGENEQAKAALQQNRDFMQDKSKALLEHLK